MTKTRREIQKEIYHFIEERFLEQGEPVVLHEIIEKFTQKYHVTDTSIRRYLEDMINSKSPFKIITWSDGNRYYTIPTVSLGFRLLSILTLAIPLLIFFLGVFKIIQLNLFEKAILIVIGFWMGYAVKYYMIPKNEKRKH